MTIILKNYKINAQTIVKEVMLDILDKVAADL